MSFFKILFLLSIVFVGQNVFSCQLPKSSGPTKKEYAEWGMSEFRVYPRHVSCRCGHWHKMKWCNPKHPCQKKLAAALGMDIQQERNRQRKIDHRAYEDQKRHQQAAAAANMLLMQASQPIPTEDERFARAAAAAPAPSPLEQTEEAL